MTLRDLPPVRALAEERAREFLNALSGPAVTWEAMPDTPESRRIKERHVETHLRLLTDLSRPGSRDAVARLVAAKVGADLSGGIVYTLTQRTEGGRKIKTWVVCDCNGDDFPVLADTKIMDPIEALQAMALAVLA